MLYWKLLLRKCCPFDKKKERTIVQRKVLDSNYTGPLDDVYMKWVSILPHRCHRKDKNHLMRIRIRQGR